MSMEPLQSVWMRRFSKCRFVSVRVFHSKPDIVLRKVFKAPTN